MIDEEGFLARWSRRKRAVAKAVSAAESSRPEPLVAVADAAARETEIVEQPAPAPLPELPSLEAIVADTDIRAFLAKGVPFELRQAAIARAWTADPVIREFVEMADYDWDWNAPADAPTSARSLAALADRIFEAMPETGAAGPPNTTNAAVERDIADQSHPADGIGDELSQHSDEASLGGRADPESSDADSNDISLDKADISQPRIQPAQPILPSVQRRHGLALPE